MSAKQKIVHGRELSNLKLTMIWNVDKTFWTLCSKYSMSFLLHKLEKLIESCKQITELFQTDKKIFFPDFDTAVFVRRTGNPNS